MRLRFAILLLGIACLDFGFRILAQQPQTARQFISDLYKHYGKNGRGVNLTGKSGRNFFASSLRTLAHRDAFANGPHQVGVLDSDPVCSCQDWDSIQNLSIDLQPVDVTHSMAHVRFSLSPGKDSRDLDLELVRERGAWRIWNIVDHTNPNAVFDLRAALRKEIRELSQSKKHTHGL
ncbi:MAG: DUF3828 domain-containing protein [Acidobacteriota bacterium]|nr:DUF3828 domain-containing protein [Acidobacteriota bacterium]